MDNQPKSLVVDDDRVCRIVLTHFLTRLGHNVVAASDGNEAIDIIKDHNFDFAFVDLRMPSITGVDIAMHFRQVLESRKKSVKVFITTADDTFDGKSLESGLIAGTITKPILEDAIRKATC